MKIILFLLFIPFLACSQPQENDWVKQHQEDYRNVVKNFYALLFNEKSSNQMLSAVYWDASLDSGMFKKIKPYLNELTGGLPKDEIFRIIDKAEICDEGLQFAVYFELSLSKNNKIYLELGSDIPSTIDKIWLSNGTLLGSSVRNESPVQKLLLVGIINDKDGYTNVREAPSNEAKVIDKITDKEYFYYVPNSKSDWWQVSRKDYIKAIVGYIHKNRILKYSEMPNEIKKHISKDRKSD
jgi:hypothetical protein